ncbi:hypothetical protein ACLKA6_008506 [Drosophila palustris]
MTEESDWVTESSGSGATTSVRGFAKNSTEFPRISEEGTFADQTADEGGSGDTRPARSANGFSSQISASGSRSEASAATRPDQPGPAPSTGTVLKRAREWYWIHVKNSRIETWLHLRQSVLDRFRGYQTEHDLMQELLQREQNASEGVDDNIHHMRQLASRFQKPFRDRDLEMEVPPGVPDPPPEDLEEASMRPRLVCWNCGQFDHMWRDCLSKERRIFCFICGKPNTFSPQCKGCPGNARMSAVLAGQARSDMTTTIRKDGQNNRM